MNVTAYPTQIKEQARTLAKEVLSLSESFLSMPMEEQRSIYNNLVDENLKKLAVQNGFAVPMATQKGPGAEMGFKDYDPGFDASVDAFEDLVDSVDFPKFVRDLMMAVFQGNLEVMKKQTDNYIKLMKEATKSVADFVKKVGDDESFAYLAETKGDQFNLSMDGDKLTLTSPEGEPVNMDDNEVKAKIMEAKIAMAQEHRAALREVILMGVTRLVVERGEIEAGVEFNIKAKRTSDKTHRDQNINTVNTQFNYDPPFGGIFGGPSGSVSMTNTNIQINTSNKKAEDEMTAKLMGKVKIIFKTDYFKLDNFATMYGDGGTRALQPGATAPAPAPAPPR
ncbi:MAG: hypothetical protein IT270_05905 [Saprospiraceae bacterium]|nr:hypothetical protein [Saprospiraceae bacterium]